VAWIRRLLVLLVVCVLGIAGSAWWALRESLPLVDGQHPLQGLRAEVQIERDGLGTATVRAQHRDDALRALGFVHAQERYFEMDLLRRSAAGELAGLFGTVALSRDRMNRVHRMRYRAEQAVAALAQDDQAALTAYTDGVNAGLAALQTRPWAYWLLRHQPAAWRSEDSLLAGYAMFFDLQDSQNRRELAWLAMREHLPSGVVSLLTADGSEWDAPLMGDARAALTAQQIRAAFASPFKPWKAAPSAIETLQGSAPIAPAEATQDAAPIGSNNFAVAGELTVDGRAIVADDMHLSLRAPNIWFRTRLIYPDPNAPGGQVDATGVSLPGVPTLVVGSNGHIAWGFTNSYGDWADWVLVEWLDKAHTRYRTAEGEATVEVIEENLAAHGGNSELLSIRETRWGPILHDLDDDNSLALRWTAHQPGSLNLDLGRLLLADNIDKALEVAHSAGVPAQNLVVGDRQGAIAWTLIGRIPRRVGDCDPKSPLVPAQGCDWDGWMAPEAAPSVIRPMTHRLWTANSRVVDAEALALIGDGGYDLGARQRQIRDALFAMSNVSESDLLAIQLDDRALFLQRWWELYAKTLASFDTDPALAPLRDLQAHWDGRAAADSVSYRLARGLRSSVLERFTAHLLLPVSEAMGEQFSAPKLSQVEAILWPAIQNEIPELLPADYTQWNEFLHASLIELQSQLIDIPGPLNGRTWGERNAAQICHPLAMALPSLLAQPLCMPTTPQDGDNNMPRVSGPGFGASQRMVVSPGHESDGLFHMPGGQSGHPLSPFWGAGHADWLAGKPTPFLPGEATHQLMLVPQ